MDVNVPEHHLSKLTFGEETLFPVDETPPEPAVNPDVETISLQVNVNKEPGAKLVAYLRLMASANRFRDDEIIRLNRDEMKRPAEISKMALGMLSATGVSAVLDRSGHRMKVKDTRGVRTIGPMLVKISKDECLRLAQAEGNEEIGAGLTAVDPTFEPLDHLEAAPPCDNVSATER